MVVGASPEPLAITPWQLIGGNRTVRGWASGTLAEAYGRMITSKVPFRAVLTM